MRLNIRPSVTRLDSTEIGIDSTSAPAIGISQGR